MASKNNSLFAIPSLMIAGLSTIALVLAFSFEYIGGLEPCSLCIYQRIPHGLAISLCLVTILFRLPPSYVAWIFIILPDLAYLYRRFPSFFIAEKRGGI